MVDTGEGRDGEGKALIDPARRRAPTRKHTARKHPDDGKALRDLPTAGTFDQKSNWTLNLKNRPSRTSVGASQLSYATL